MRLSLVIGIILPIIFGCASEKKSGQSLTIPPVPVPEISELDRENAIIAIENLKDDSTKWNCHDAMRYLYLRREQLTPILIENLNYPDSQVQQALIRTLCETETFKPDESFIRRILDQLENQFTLDLQAHHSIKYDFIGYLAFKSSEFHDVIASYLNKKDIFIVYAVTHSLNAGGMLNEHLSEYNKEVMSFITGNLLKTDIPYGKSYSVRICFMLGDHSVPYLRQFIKDYAVDKNDLPELVLRQIVEPDKKWLDKIREHGCIIESYYLRKSPEYPYGFVPLSDVLSKRSPHFLGERKYSLPPE